MPRTPGKVCLIGWIIFFAGLIGTVRAQQTEIPNRDLEVIALLRFLEEQHQVKFSYVDEDLIGMRVELDPQGALPNILEELRQQTQLRIVNLDERYYTVAKSPLVTVCGRVMDNFEESGIQAASIEVLGSSIAAVTDADGMFRLEGIPRKAILGIRHLGFKTRYVQAEELLRQNPCSSLVLSLVYQELEQVTVIKFLTTGLSKQEDGSIQMNTATFGLLPGLSEPDVLQGIQALPGIKSIDETVSDINIRGGTNDQNLILWDGIKMYQSGHFFGLISAFNPYLTENITIIKNGASARYGDGLSGIVSMQTYDQVSRTYYGGAGFNLISGDAFAHIPLSDRIAVQVSARRSVTDILNTPTYSSFSDRAFQDTEISGPGAPLTPRIQERDNNFYFYDFSGKLIYDIDERHSMRVSGLFIRNNLFYSETLTEDDSQNRADLDQFNIGVGGRLNSRWNERLSSEISGYYTQYELDSDFEIQASGQRLFQLNQVAESALKTLVGYRFNQQLKWNFGYQFIGTGITNTSIVNQPPFSSQIKDVLYANALFSEWQYKGPGGRFSTIAGIRLNYLYNPDDFDRFLLEPRLSMHYELNQDLYLELLGEFKNQSSLQFVDLEQNFLGVEKRRWILADEQALPVVTSRQGSVGLHYDRGYWLASLEGFYKEVDGITTDTQGFQNENQFNGEIGQYWVHGVEALINYKDEVWSTWVSYAWNQNRYRFEDLDPQEFPNNLDIRHTLTLGSTVVYGDFKLGLGLNYRTGRPFTEPQPPPNAIDTTVFPNQINFDTTNNSRLPEYIRADASLQYDFELSETVRATAGASVLNLTGRRNILNTYYRLNEDNEIEKIESVSLGLTPNISFRVRF